MTESPYPMIEVDVALASVMERVSPLQSQPVPLAQARGMVIARDIAAGEPMPPFASAAVDGFAVVASDGTGSRPVVGDAPAGSAPALRVEPGTAVRIATGAPVPDGADAVVMVEYTRFENGTVTVDAQVSPGDGIRRAGTDHQADETLLEAGSVLEAAHIGLAASAGCALVEAHRRPHVAVLSTGDELVGITEVLGPGQIRDSNRLALLAAVEEAGGIPLDGGHVGDSDEATEALAMVARAADLVVTSGGVSMGHRDRVKPWLEKSGEVVFGRVRMKPGKPATFGIVNGKPIFALPGFPVSALVTFELFVRPAIRRMAGHREPNRPLWVVTLADDARSDPNRVEFARARVTLGPSGPVAHLTGAQGSGRILSLADANALVRLDQTTPEVMAGTKVSAMILGRVDAR